MELIDNKSKLLGDDLKREIKKDAKVRMVASYFSIYAFEALKEELSGVEELQFIFPTPTFVKQGMDAFKRAVQRLVGDFSEIVQVVRETAEEELKSQQTSNLTVIEDELVEQRKAVLELFKKKKAGEISPTEYDRKYAEYSARIIELESVADTAKSEELQKQLTQSRLERVYDLLDNIGTDYTDEGVMRTLIDCIKVEGKHDIEFQFKCGVDIHETI